MLELTGKCVTSLSTSGSIPPRPVRKMLPRGGHAAEASSEDQQSLGDFYAAKATQKHVIKCY